MGRIKTKPIKSAGDELFEKHGESYSKDFSENKKVLPQHAEVRSKKIRNILAGYLTKKAKRSA
jgi:small subunit ribosomal protein S17e